MKKHYLYIVLFLFIISCSKSDEGPVSDKVQETEEEFEEKPAPIIEGGLTVSEKGLNITSYNLVIDTTATSNIKSIAISDADLSNKITVGTVLMDSETGFMVKVTGKDQDLVTVEDASLDEYFIDGVLVFGSTTTGKDALSNKASDFSVAFNKELYRDEIGSIGVNGNLSFDPDINGEIDFGSKTFNVKIIDAPLTISGELDITASGEMTSEEIIELGSIQINQLYGVVFVTYKLSIYDKIVVDFSGSLTETIAYTQTFNVNASLDYDEAFSSDFSAANTSEDLEVKVDGKVNLNIRHEIVPKLEIQFYRVAGPFMEFVPYDTFNATATLSDSDLDWDFYAQRGIDFRLGASTKLFKGKSYAYSWPVGSPRRIYEMPYETKLLSETEIEASGGKELDSPVKVKVLDSRENPVAGVMVYAEIKEGTGELVEDKIFTNMDGVAEFTWKMGCEADQKLELYAKKADGTVLRDTKSVVKAKVAPCGGLELTRELNFGNVQINTTDTRIFTITNNSESNVVISISDIPQGYSLDWVNGSIAANSQQEIRVSFSPIAAQQYSGSLTVADDINEFNNTIVVNGNGTENAVYDLFTDAAAIKKILEVNGIDVSDPRWESRDSEEVIDYLSTTYGIGFTYLGRVFRLNLWELNINLLPPEIGHLTQLEMLILTNNNIEVLPPEIGNLTYLKYLDINNNKLSSLPSEIGNLTKLTDLIVMGNYLSSLPSEIENLKQLEVLVIRNNNFNSYPTFLGNLSTLNHINLLNNPALCIPQEIWDLHSSYNTIISIELEVNDTDCSE
ncbi:hypothetical protein MWU78_16130 [Arenibacter sp. F26102]|uniref:leucine-rich repeat domain-containing protein n=1 Tax=Arenibacter sp. F26102 TaxID=2926416 RepID=UPI001FF6EC3A|nr:leucine-rich repeat domain-containing protein [Arenibacter sp. F26102]MCK0147187.1 hypothetical protein [Arenibacter sp. F26102]